MMTRKWTKEEIELLKSGVAPLGRSLFAIKVMRRKLGFVAYRVPKWTQEHKIQLKTLLAEGKSTKEISQILPYTVRSVQKEIVRQKLPHKTACRFTKIEKEDFKNFLKENWKAKTPKDLVELWNQSNRRKVNHRKVVVYLKLLNIKISKSEVMKMTLLRKKQDKLSNQVDLDKNVVLETIKESRIRIMSERLAQGKDIWTGLNLPTLTPLEIFNNDDDDLNFER